MVIYIHACRRAELFLTLKGKVKNVRKSSSHTESKNIIKLRQKGKLYTPNCFSPKTVQFFVLEIVRDSKIICIFSLLFNLGQLFLNFGNLKKQGAVAWCFYIKCFHYDSFISDYYFVHGHIVGQLGTQWASWVEVRGSGRNSFRISLVLCMWLFKLLA
eukprot:TRINITY_DN20661_c0_g2_i2.p3 TRINITY_DN20661_c0_g2~~TRINITY_DN20661_c0_g2_i2.p3  ORF type:complete len:158 (+),score=3.16 TRINITY_DN20661_c0_g2_i2:562-1035(+)